MGRHDHGNVDDDHHDSIMVVGSSIALLQERFRQLERVREKKKKRIGDPISNSSSRKSCSSSSSSSSSTLSLGMMMNNSTSPRQRKTTIAYEHELNREEDVKRRQRLTGRWLDYDSAMATVSTPSSDQISEVDTSLHL